MIAQDVFFYFFSAFPIASQEVSTGERPLKPVTVHRALLKGDLIDIFRDQGILEYDVNVTIIGHNGKEEEGQGSGVLREVLTSFWQECFSSLTVGASEKVPSVRHDYQKGEWEAIARIIVYGYSFVKYFPIALSPAFVATVFFGEESLTPEFLIESFKPYLSLDEREVLDKALGDDFDPSNEDLLDLLSTFKCYKSPTKTNIFTIVHELAHQELVQKPRYIVDCFAPILNRLRVYTPFQTLEDLQKFYSAKKPTAKKVINLLSANPAPGAEQNSMEHFKRFVKSLTGNDLGSLLQFLTGSNIIVCEMITVTFTTLDGKTRRPFVHTCGPTLELPSTYQCYNELAEEFTALLNAKDSWSFNII